jgi:hypothetical protein
MGSRAFAASEPSPFGTVPAAGLGGLRRVYTAQADLSTGDKYRVAVEDPRHAHNLGTHNDWLGTHNGWGFVRGRRAGARD